MLLSLLLCKISLEDLDFIHSVDHQQGGEENS